MKLTPIEFSPEEYPDKLHPLLSGAALYDSSCSEQARVVFIDKDCGYFLKSAPIGALKREADMTRYFHGKGLSAEVLEYFSHEQNERDWLLTAKISGDDGIAPKYLEQPKRLCDIWAEQLVILHGLDYSDCPVQNHRLWMIEKAEQNKRTDNYDKSNFPGGMGEQQNPKDFATSPDSFGYKSAEEAWAVVENHGHLLKADTLLHGDYCLPNIILDNWQFRGFVDVGNGGVGDRHVDIFWGTWTLFWNLHTHDYRQRFIDAYGRDKVDEDMLRIVAAIEAFG